MRRSIIALVLLFTPVLGFGHELNMFAPMPQDLQMFEAAPAPIGNMLAVDTKKREIHFYGPTWCPYCPAKKAEVKKLENEFSISYFHDDTKYPAHILKKAAEPNWGYAMVHWKLHDGTWRVMPWIGIDGFRKSDDKPKTTSIVAEASPTPGVEVERVIGLLPVPQIGFVDWGCGDGRVCIAAAERWGCRVTGVEIDPVRAQGARDRVRAAGLDHLITIVTGDAVTTDVVADVGYCYGYSGLLEQLQPQIEKLQAFASYMHSPPGLPVFQNGDTWFYVRVTQQSQSHSAVWQGQYYSQPVCNDPNCAMCRSIRKQLNR